MAFQKKTWKNRLSEFPNRRRLEPTGIENTYDVVRAEGNVTETGDAFSEDSMNDLEERIATGLADGAITTALHTRTGTTNNLDIPTGAKNLTFLATADLADGDSWTINGQPVTAVLQNGEPLPGDLFKAGCWVTGVRLSDDGTQLFFRAGASTVPSIFGNGSDGDAVISGTVTLPVPVPHQSIVEKQYKSLTINAGAILKCASWNAGLIIRVQGDCIIHGTIDQSGLAPKTNLQNNYPYPSQLICGNGGQGGPGGTGKLNNVNITNYGVGGSTMLKRTYGGGYGSGGSGGSGSNGSGSTSTGGTGGSSSSITIDISNIFIPGNYGGGGNGGYGGAGGQGAGGTGGSGGGTGNYGGGGGGAGNYGGGIVLLYVGGNLTIDGFIKCNGSDGGTGGINGFVNLSNFGGSGGGGGGGGGGAIYIYHKGIYTNSGILQVNGGNGGLSPSTSGGQGSAGNAGGVGSISVIQHTS